MQIESAMEIGVRVAGVLQIGLALAHAFLPKLLGWPDDIAKLRPINQHVFLAHALFIIVGIFLLGVICLAWPELLVAKTRLALVATGAFTTCWVARLCFQFTVFRGEVTGTPKLDIAMHLIGTVLWLVFSVIFGSVFWYQLH